MVGRVFYRKKSSEKTKKHFNQIGSHLLLARNSCFLQPEDLHKTYFDKGSDAGELMKSLIQLSNKQKAWHLPQVPWPTWVSNKWNVTTTSLSNAQDLGTVPSDDIVLFRTDRIPDCSKRSRVRSRQTKRQICDNQGSVMKGFIIGASE